MIFADESLFWDVRRESTSARDASRNAESMPFDQDNKLHKLSVLCNKAS